MQSQNSEKLYITRANSHISELVKTQLTDGRILSQLATVIPRQIRYGKLLGWSPKRIAAALDIPMIEYWKMKEDTDYQPRRSRIDVINFIANHYEGYLHPREAQVWACIHIMGWKIQQVAEILGVSKSTVKNRYYSVGEKLDENKEIANVYI